MRLAGILARVFFAAAVAAGAGRVAAQEPVFEFVADSAFHHRTGRQAVLRSRFDFNEPAELRKFPLQFGEWEGVDIPMPARPVVKPDFMFERSYRHRRGETIWFQLIRGRIERAVHVPAICYYNAGWRILERGTAGVRIGKQTLPCGRMLVAKDDLQATELYFYLWEDPKRDFMKGCVMFRIAAFSRGGDPELRGKLAERFVRDLFREVGRME